MSDKDLPQTQSQAAAQATPYDIVDIPHFAYTPSATVWCVVLGSIITATLAGVWIQRTMNKRVASQKTLQRLRKNLLESLRK